MLAAVELVYLIAANAFLHSDFGRRVLNRRPDQVRVELEGVWTPLPGVVRLRGLDLAGESRRVRWSTRIDRGWTALWLPSLAFRHVRIVGGRQRGVAVDIEILPRPGEPRPRRPDRGWRVTLGGLRVDDLRRVRVDDYEVEGEGTLRGSIRLQVRGPMELDIRRLRVEDGVVRSSGRELAERLHLSVGFHTDPWRVGRQPVGELIAGASGELELEARVENLAFVNAHLRKIPWLGLGGEGDLALDLVVERGSLLPGSSMALTGDRLFADLFDFRALGDGRVGGSVESEGSGIALAARLEGFTVQRSSDGASMLAGEGLDFLARLASTSLSAAPEDVAGAVSLDSARADDLSRFGPYFPGGLELELQRGAAALSLDLVYDTAARSGEGRVEIDLHEAAARYADAGVAASGRLDVRLPALDLEAGRFDLSGTTLRLDDGRIDRGGAVRSQDWWARIAIPSGALELPQRRAERMAAPRAAAFAADLEVTMADSAPVVVVMEQRLPKLRFVDRLLTFPEVELRGHVEAREGRLALHHVEVTGGEQDQLAIRLHLDLEGPRTTGAAYARYRGLDAAVVLSDGDRDWAILHPKRRYEEALAELDRAGRPRNR